MSKRNKVMLSGMVLDNPKFSHQRSNGKNYYLVMLASKRKSETSDVLRCIIPEKLVTEFSAGKRIGIHGELRKHSSEEQMKKLGKRNVAYVLASETYEWHDHDDNFVVLTGKVKKLVHRVTPKGLSIADLCLKHDFDDSDRSVCADCILWNENASATVYTEIGEEVIIYGRLQSREYQKTTETGETRVITTYEVSVGQFHYI